MHMQPAADRLSRQGRIMHGRYWPSIGWVSRSGQASKMRSIRKNAGGTRQRGGKGGQEGRAENKKVAGSGSQDRPVVAAY